MKNRRLAAMAVTLAIILAAPAAGVHAESAAQLQDQYGQALAKLEIVTKDSKGSLRLKDKTKRYEFISFVDAMMCYEPAPDKAKNPFKDITSKHKGYKAIMTAAANNIIQAAKDGTIKPDASITYSDALSIVLKALGYGDEIKDLNAAALIERSVELGLTGEALGAANKQITKGEAYTILYNALTVNFYGVTPAVQENTSQPGVDESGAG